MRWHIKRSKLLFALIPIISIAFYVLTADHNLYANQSFVAFDIYQQISSTEEAETGKTPADYTAAKNFAIAAGVYLNTDAVQSTTNGTVTAMGFYKQTVINYRAKEGGRIFNESVSLSAIASVAEQRFFKDGAILYRSGKASGSAVKSWSDEIVELAPAVYRQRYGVVPREISKYSVTKDSIISESLVTENGNGTYTFELELDAEEAQKFARYEMMTYAGVTSFPEFYSCKIVCTVDSDWKVLEICSYDSYKIALMGGIKCDSRMVETFTYNDSGFPDRAQIFIDYVPTGNTGTVDSAKSPADYLSEAYGDYITGAKVLNLTADVNIGGNLLKVKGSIDLIGGIYAFGLEPDIYAVYKGTTLYLALGQNKYSLDVNALKDLGGDSISGGLGGLDFGDDMLATLFENYTLTESIYGVHIKMPFSLMGMDFDVDMGLARKSDGTVTADTIDAIIKRGDFDITVAAKITDSVDLPTFDANGYESLAPLLNAVKATIDERAYKASGNIEVSVDDRTLSVPVSARLIKTDKGFDAEATLDLLGTEITVKYVGETIYASVGGITVKAKAEDLPALAAAVSELIPDGNTTTDTEALISAVLPELLPGKLELSTALDLLTAIEYRDGKLSLSVTPAAGTPYVLSLEHGKTLSAVSLSGLTLSDLPGLNSPISLGFDFELSPASCEEIEIPDLAADAHDLANFLPKLGELVKAESYGAQISGNVSLLKKSLPLDANMTFNRADGSMSGTLAVNDQTANFARLGSVNYLSYDSLRVKIADSDLTALVAAIYGSDASDALASLKGLLPEGGLDIGSVLPFLSLASDAQSFTLSYATDSLSVRATVSLCDEKIKLALSAESEEVSLSLDALLCGYDEYRTVTVSGEYRDAAEIVPFIAPVKNALTCRNAEFTIAGNIGKDGLEESFTVQTVITRGNADISDPYDLVRIDATLTVSGVQIDLIYANGTVYADIGNDISLKAALPALPEKVTEALEPLAEILGMLTDKPTENFSAILAALSELPLSSAPDFDISSVLAVIDGIEIVGNVLSAPVNANGVSFNVTLAVEGNSIREIAVTDLAVKGVSAEISVNGFSFDTDRECDEIYEEDYSDATVLAAFLPAIKELAAANGYEVALDSGYLSTPVISGDLGGKIRFSRESLDASARLTLGEHEVNAWYINKTVYLQVNDIMLSFTPQEMQDFKNELASFGLGNVAEAAVAALTEERTSLLASMLGGKSLSEIVGMIADFSTAPDGTVTVKFSAEGATVAAHLSLTADDKLQLYAEKASYSEIEASFTAVLTPTRSLEIAPPENIGDFVKLSELQSYVAPVIGTLEQKCYSLDFGGTVYDKADELTTIGGSLKIDRLNNLKIYLNIELGGKTGTQSFKLYLIENGESDKLKAENFSAYIDFNGFTASIGYESAVKTLGEICEILDLDIPLVNELTAAVGYVPTGTDVFETFDIPAINKLRDTLSSLFDKAEDVSDTATGSSGLKGLMGLISDGAVNKALKGITLRMNSDKLLEIVIDNAIFDKENAGKAPAVITLGHANGFMQYADIANVIANGDTVNFTANLTCGSDASVCGEIVPPANIKCDLNGMEDFLYTILKTADMREFEISGDLNVNINIPVVFSVNLSLGITARIKILDDGTTVLAFNLDIPRTTAKILGIPSMEVVPKSSGNIYFVNGMLYFVVDQYNYEGGLFNKTNVYKSTNFVACTPTEFAADPYYYIFDVALRMNSTVKDLMLKEINKSNLNISLKDTLTNIDSIINSCALTSDGTFTLVVDLNKLTGDSNFSTVTVKIGTAENYVRSLYVETTVANIVTLKLENTALTNLTANADGNTVATPVSPVELGRDTKGKELSHEIDKLEDDLALLFPEEGARTFAEKALSKAAKADAKAVAAVSADEAVSSAVLTLESAQKEYELACSRLEGLTEGKLSYDRALARVNYAAISLARAESDLRAAKLRRIDAAKDAERAASVAYEYSAKATKAADALGADSADAAIARDAAQVAQTSADGAHSVAAEILEKALLSAEEEYAEAKVALDLAQSEYDEALGYEGEDGEEILQSALEALEKAKAAAEEAEELLTSARNALLSLKRK